MMFYLLGYLTVGSVLTAWVLWQMAKAEHEQGCPFFAKGDAPQALFVIVGMVTTWPLWLFRILEIW